MPENYGRLLKSYRKSDDEITPEQREKLNAELEKIAASRKRPARLIAFLRTAAAAAAVFLVIFAAWHFTGSGNNDGEKIFEAKVAQGMPVTVNLLYDAKEDLENVRFSLELEDGVSFLSADETIRNTRSHTWTGSLKKGKNSIPFVVKTEKYGKINILASAEYGNYIHKEKIVLDANKDEVAVSMFLLAPESLDR